VQGNLRLKKVHTETNCHGRLGHRRVVHHTNLNALELFDTWSTKPGQRQPEHPISFVAAAQNIQGIAASDDSDAYGILTNSTATRLGR
jgi:hypothetical protein